MRANSSSGWKFLAIMLFLWTFLILFFNLGTLQETARANLSHITFLAHISDSNPSLRCDRLLPSRIDTLPVRVPDHINGPLALARDLGQVWNTAEIAPLTNMVRKSGQLAYPIIAYINCANDFMPDEQQTMLQLVGETITPGIASHTIQAFNTTKRELSKDPEIEITLYEQLLSTVPDNQIGNTRLVQLYYRSGQLDKAIQLALHVIEFEPVTRFNLQAYVVLVRSYLEKGQCEDAYATVASLNKHFSEASISPTLKSNALTSASSLERRINQAGCSPPTD